MRLTAEELTARKRRNLALAWGLVAFMVLVFVTTYLRMQHNSQAAREANAAAVAATYGTAAPARPATTP